MADKPVVLELRPVEAYYLTQALEFYVKNAPYGHYRNWIELHNKVKQAAYENALANKHGPRQNPSREEHLRRAAPHMKKAQKELSDAEKAVLSQRPVVAAKAAARAYAHAVQTMDDLTDASDRPMAHVGKAYQAAVDVTRRAMDLLGQVGQAASVALKKAKPKKKASKRAGDAKENPNRAAKKLLNRIGRL